MSRRGRLDAVVVGGGVVGCAAALALARAGLEVALLEAKAPPAWTPERRDLRVYAFAPDNAAQTLHPIGAQGFNLGLRDALTLAELIEATDDPGATALLDEHARRRAEDRAQTLQFSGGLARLTANEDDSLRPLRSLGFGAVQHLPALRAQLVGGALGYRGDVPRLCRSGA